MDLYSLSFLLVGKMVQGTSENGFKMEFSAVNFFFFFQRRATDVFINIL